MKFPRQEYWSAMDVSLSELRELVMDREASVSPLLRENGTPLQYFCLENPMDGGAW